MLLCLYLLCNFIHPWVQDVSMVHALKVASHGKPQDARGDKALLCWEQLFFAREGRLAIHASPKVISDVLQQINLANSQKPWLVSCPTWGALACKLTQKKQKNNLWIHLEYP